MDLVKISKRFAQFLGNEQLSLNDIYTHLTSDTFTKQIIEMMEPISIIKIVFLTKSILIGQDPVRLNEVLEQNLFLFSIIEFGDDPEIECDNCNGNGNVECSYCDGSGEVDCSNCDGSGEVECNDCEGTGFNNEVEDENSTCSTCGGSGEITCPDCSGSHKESCPDCGGSGSDECYICNGSGYNSKSGANYDIEMFASYNPVLFNTLEKIYKETSEINSDSIERNQTFLFNTKSMYDSDENTEIDTYYQNKTFVNGIIKSEFELLDETSISSHNRDNFKVNVYMFEDPDDKFK